MLKWLAMLAILLTFVAVGFLSAQNAPSNAPEHGIGKAGGGQNAGGQPQATDGKQPTPNTPPAAPQPPTPTCDEACQQGRENLAIQRKLEWFTRVLAIVGVLQVATMVWQGIFLRRTWVDIHFQANTMETQAKEAKESAATATAIAKEAADAARDSADALVSAERGWVLPSISRTIPAHNVVKCELIFTNYGATPAIIESFSCKVEWNLPVVEFPQPPQYGEKREARIILAPQEAKNLGTVFPVQEFPYFGVERAIFIGYVSYGGIFTGERITKFCFGYDKITDAFIPIGPAAYNDVT
jgi:hypothetical protein